MSNPNDRAYLPEDGHEDDEDQPRDRRSRHSGGGNGNGAPKGNDKRKRKLALGSRGQHRHRRGHHHHHRQQKQLQQEEQQPQHGANAEELLEHFRQLLQDGEGRPGRDIQNIQKARNALEATAGNMEMAAQLYWDDYIASQAVSNAAAPPPPPPQEEAEADRKVPARRNESLENDDEDDDDDPPSPGLRRSLDGEFGRAADAAQLQRGNNDDDDDDDDGDDEDDDQDVMGGQHQIHRPFAGDLPAPAPMAMDENSDDGEGEDQDVIDRRQRQRQILRDAILGQQARLDMGESVSVSDDETGCAGVWKIVGTMVAQLDEDDAAAVSTRRNRRLPANDVGQRVREAAAAVADKVLSQPDPSDGERKRKRLRKEEEEDDTEYISDRDWLEDDTSPVKDPFELLWGTRTSNISVPSDPSMNENAEGNVVADEDADEKSGAGVPHTWLHASFSLSECGTGLMVQPPKVEDIEFFAWRQQNQGRNSRNGVPPPYHCKAITALTSIVTAMLYTGASIQGDEVNCTSAKIPFAELSADEKKREFEGRLGEALAALMFIAGKASLKRKERSMKKVSGTGQEKECKVFMMKRRLHLIPTCTWEDEPSAGMPRQPDSPSYRYIQVATSLTNIDDIRLFVHSSIRAFTARGGVALLLETVLRIHGKGVIKRMIQRARKDAGLPETVKQCLIDCTCEDRQKKMYGDKPLPSSVRNDPSKLLDTTPPGHECVSVELISLLLTGTVHSSWTGWSAEGLDFGILTKKSGEVGFELARPEKPVWVLQGDTCYSVLWLRASKELDPRIVAKLDKPGEVLDFSHWNCWYELRNKSEFRLSSPSDVWKPPVSKQLTADVWATCRNSLEPRNAADLLLERRRYKRVNLISAGEHESNLKKETQLRVTEADLENVTQNPEDENYYPKNYTMWRFDMGDGKEEQDDDSCAVGDIKMRAERWVPYHRLSSNHKLIVDIKLGPKIKSILWTRWPGARIDKFVPEDGTFPVV
jgi:hypothetical protein